ARGAQRSVPVTGTAVLAGTAAGTGVGSGTLGAVVKPDGEGKTPPGKAVGEVLGVGRAFPEARTDVEPTNSSPPRIAVAIPALIRVLIA
ncbi:MAG TPA: hypothetical protein VMV09_02645, partial [Candidatus Saccharimonadales bacterium]|nr:hypothetical protein [Candidatus Saccharimonadales bacterium]